MYFPTPSNHEHTPHWTEHTIEKLFYSMFIPFTSPDSGTTIQWLGKDTKAWCICTRQEHSQHNPSIPQQYPNWLTPFTICQQCQAILRPPLSPPARETTTRCMSCNTNLTTVSRKLQCGTCHRCLHYPNPLRPALCASTSAQLQMLHPTLGWTCPICMLSIARLVAHTYHNNRTVLAPPNTQQLNADAELDTPTPSTTSSQGYTTNTPMSTPANLLIPEPTTNATAARIKLTDYLNKIITRCITDQGAACFSPPPPRSTNEFTLTVGNTPPLVFKELDWGTTFTAFAHNIPHSTRNRFLLTETNKCFIIHLAMAANLSPIRLWAQLKKHVLHRTSHPLLRADLAGCLPRRYTGP
jgi:hypothetical protein